MFGETCHFRAHTTRHSAIGLIVSRNDYGNVCMWRVWRQPRWPEVPVPSKYMDVFLSLSKKMK